MTKPNFAAPAPAKREETIRAIKKEFGLVMQSRPYYPELVEDLPRVKRPWPEKLLRFHLVRPQCAVSVPLGRLQSVLRLAVSRVNLLRPIPRLTASLVPV